MWKHIVSGITSVLMLCTTAAGQGLDNLWLGGYDNWFGAVPYGGSNLDFFTGSPMISVQGRSVDIFYTTSNITDSAGELLFFSNGVVVGDQNGDTMQNGTGLNPSFYTDWYPNGLALYQANLIIPDPGDNDRYYLFHNTVDVQPEFYTQYEYVTTIDMSLNSGLGSVISKNQIIHEGAMQYGHLTAVKHGNGRDWWIYAHELDTDVFLRWLLTPSGISGPTSQSVGSVRPLDAGQVVFSPNGQRFAYFDGQIGLDVFDVDRCAGTFSNQDHVEVDSADFGIGAAFSPNGRFLYLSAYTCLYQVDMNAADPQASLQLIATWDSTYSPSPPFATLFGASKLAPDGKIYISTMNGTDKLHVINYPDSLGLACDLVQHAITLPTYWSNSLPNHPNYHLGALDGSVCDSLGLGVAEVPVDLNLALYPNPSNGAFTLSFAPQPVAGTVEVIDLQGRVVFREAVAPWSQLKRLQLHQLNAGVYECRLRFGSAVSVKHLAIE